MELDNDTQLRTTYEHIVRMYELCDRIAVDTTGKPSTRADEIEGVKAMIRKLEGQVVRYVDRRRAAEALEGDAQPEPVESAAV